MPGKTSNKNPKMPRGSKGPSPNSDAITISLLVLLAALQILELVFPFIHLIVSGLQIVVVIGVILRWRALGNKSIQREQDIINYYGQDLEDAKKQIRSFDITDQLTGLYTYPYFQSRLETEIDRARRYNHPISIVIVDLVSFSDFNQRHGRLMVEAILKRFTVGVLRRVLRNTDLIGRYGGDQFIVMLTETPKEGAAVAAKRLQDVASTGILLPNGERVNLPIQYGISTFPADAVSADSLVRAADKDLSTAKQRERIKS